MRFRLAVIVALSSFLCLLMFAASKDFPEARRKARKFTFTYETRLSGWPATAHRVRVWIPLPWSDESQEVTFQRRTSTVPVRMTRDPVFGNRMLYAELHEPKRSAVSFSLEYVVTRKEHSKGDFVRLMRYNHAGSEAPPRLGRFLQPDRLVPIDGKMRTLAEEKTQGKQGAIEKARAIYDYVFHTLRYDKSGSGWGRGDSLWACDARRGNCTDFHSLFISMMRAEKIPARFEIGFSLPENTPEGDIPGYHCWAEFYVDGPGWIPVDISEAWRNPTRQDYFFGTLDANRVQFTMGRDLTLSPRQDGPPLNYFIYPYVEVDGQPYEKMEKKFTFREQSGEALAAMRK